MPSFDIVSELNLQEVDNAVNQTKKEIITRYDFKGSKSDIVLDKDGIHLTADDDYKMKALIDILQNKAVKRGISLKALEVGKIEEVGGSLLKCLVKLTKGIETEKAREIVKIVKGMNLKVQAAIEGEKLRVSGKNRDDLQSVMQALRAKDFPIPLQFNNFRD
ncbi:MAG: YajQ family cyclic di-GMP-binding protein [Deltaproteobacteria bacterium]|nr:YajQ family cyclic di-GMP-binding protein [Deltaproteobacteria bacterium]